MTIDIYSHLASIDHGQLADLISNAKVVELVSEIQKGREKILSRGKIIADAIGGVQALLTDKYKRNKLFLTFSNDQEDIIKGHLKIDDIYNLRLTKDRREKLFSIFGIEEIEEDTEEYSKEAVGAVGVEYGLFKHQSNALLKAIDFLNSDSKRVMLHMPTGAGKTRTAMHLISRYLNTVQSGIVIWIVYGLELCLQASSEFKKAWSVLGERPIPLIEMWGGKSGSRPDQIEEYFMNSGREINITDFEREIWPIGLDDAAIIASIDTLIRLIDTWEPGELSARTEKVRLIVFDEAHQAAATTYKRAIESIGLHAALLGLSATPGRRHHGEVGVADEVLVELFGGNKVDLQVPGYTSPIEALIEQGYLARLEKEKLNVVNSNLSSDEIKNVRTKLSQYLDVDESFMKIVGFHAIRNLQIIEKVESLIEEEHKRIIVFAPSIESSNLLANILRSIGICSQSITSFTRPEYRKKYLSEYTAYSDEPYVLCNYGVLTTGFDAPQTSAVIIGRPTTSIVLLNQMAGRALRGPKVGGNKSAKMVTVVDTAIPELVDTVNQFHAFDESWRTS